jgi:hypothetical protein
LQIQLKRGIKNMKRYGYDTLIISFILLIILGSARYNILLAKRVRPQPPTTTLKEIARCGPFIAYDNGTVKDTKTGFMWAGKDNGEDITWQDAKRYCENYRGGGYSDWRMPTKDELEGTYDENKENRYGIHITNKLIDISSCCSWALETRGSLAVRFNFYYGRWNWACQSGSLHTRALPVRSGN